MKKAILSLLLAAISTGAMAEWVQVYWGETSDAGKDGAIKLPFMPSTYRLLQPRLESAPTKLIPITK